MFLWYVHLYVWEGALPYVCVCALLCVCTYLFLGVRTQVYFRYLLSLTCNLHFGALVSHQTCAHSLARLPGQ